MKLNLGNERDLKEVLINAILPTYFQAQTKELLVDYRDVLTWSYKDLKGIPKEISLLEILSFTTNHYATCMQLVVLQLPRLCLQLQIWYCIIFGPYNCVCN
jgi:hypothetical protein